MQLIDDKRVFRRVLWSFRLFQRTKTRPPDRAVKAYDEYIFFRNMYLFMFLDGIVYRHSKGFFKGGISVLALHRFRSVYYNRKD